MLDGSDANSIRRRNAMVNSLSECVPHEDKRTVYSAARACLYALAPGVLWQFFSGQGMSGSKKTSLSDKMPDLYKALIASITMSCKCSQRAAVAALSDILKGLWNRKEAKQYREAHPEEVEIHKRPEKSFQSTESTLSNCNVVSSDEELSS